jgi:hypothetical protein
VHPASCRSQLPWLSSGPPPQYPLRKKKQT